MPADVIDQLLLKERPGRGRARPRGAGSAPGGFAGMEIGDRQRCRYEVLAFTKSGKTSVYAGEA